jgi:predicted alpha/beta-fold hydrolase
VRAAWLLGAVSVAGCASLTPAPQPRLHAAALRTTDLEAEPALQHLRLNRAARLDGHSQAAIKPQLQSLWRPSRRLSTLANYNGLMATRYSQVDTEPSGIFREETLALEHLGQPTQVPCIMALHADKRLPLVVGVSGINGTVNGKITVEILEHLYRTGEFHVVHLESITSVKHCARNGRPFAGGFPEGLLLYELLRELRGNPAFAAQIQQVHLLGVSFGGLLCGIAAHLEGEIRAGAVDGAVLSFSPPMDLKLLFANLRSNRLIYQWVHDGYLMEGADGYLKHHEFGLTDRELARLDFDAYMRRIALPYVQRVHPALRQHVPDLPPVEHADDLYAISSMRPLLDRLGVPFFAIQASDDPVVSPRDHFHRLLRSSSNPLVDGLLVKDGGHLGFDLVCGYPFTARLAEEYFRYWSVRSDE